MNKWKSISRYVLAVVLLLCVLTGCGNAVPTIGTILEEGGQILENLVEVVPEKESEEVEQAEEVDELEDTVTPIEDEEHSSEGVTEQGETLQIDFIDVGQADATLLRAGDEVMLIDAGDNKTEKELVQWLQSQGITKIDYLIGTHPHADHIGGLDKVIDHFEIGMIYMPKVTHTTKTFESVLTSAQNKGYKIHTGKAGVSFTFGEQVEVEMLSPIADTYDDLNNYSIVMRLVNGNDTFLFTGDAEKEVEEELLAKGYDVSATVLKVGHHGSTTSSTEAFITAVNPTYGIIFSGEGNKYGHPHQEIVALLEDNGITYYDTKEVGTISLVSTGDAIKITTEK